MPIMTVNTSDRMLVNADSGASDVCTPSASTTPSQIGINITPRDTIATTHVAITLTLSPCLVEKPQPELYCFLTRPHGHSSFGQHRLPSTAQFRVLQTLEDHLGHELHVLGSIQVRDAGALVSLAEIRGLGPGSVLMLKGLDHIALVEEECELDPS
jgi:hypothetical protein